MDTYGYCSPVIEEKSGSSDSSKRAAFFDVDNTLIKGSSLYFLSRGMYSRGFFNKRDILAFVIANLRFKLSGEKSQDEVDRIQNAAMKVVKGKNVDEMLAMGDEIYTKYVTPTLWEGTLELAREHISQGEEVWLVTATPVEVANLIAERLGLTGGVGTVAEKKNGEYTGFIEGKLLHGKEKALAVVRLAEEHGFVLKQCYAYSDSHNDFPLLESVGNPRAINPDALLRIRAAKDHWPIYDFRRARWLTSIVAPIINRAAAIAGGMNATLKKKKR